LFYLRSLLRYSVTFLRTAFFVAVLLLIYFLSCAVLLKSMGNPSFLTESLRNYGIVIVRALPFIAILASLMYFSNISSAAGKPFMITMIPLLAIFNTAIFCLSFYFNPDFMQFTGQSSSYYYPEISQDRVNDIGGYKIVLKSGGRGSLFYNNMFIFNDLKPVNNNISLNTETAVYDASIAPSYIRMTIPYRTEAVNSGETGISDYLIKNFLEASRSLQSVFLTLISGSSLPVLIFSMLFMNLGFFALACSLAVFFSDRQTILLSWSLIFLLAAALFLALPQYFIFISIIKSGIRSQGYKLILPSIFVGIPGGLIGYILISIRASTSGRNAVQGDRR